jgi:hypothetical protein
MTTTEVRAPAGSASEEELANGFERFNLALETPFNLVLEARP